MKPLIGTLLLALVLFLSLIDYSSTADRHSFFPGILESSDPTRYQDRFAANNPPRNHINHAQQQGQRSNQDIHVPILESNPLHGPSLQLKNIGPGQQPQHYRDPAHAHLDIDLNRLPPEASYNPQQHHVYRPVARYPSGARYPGSG